MVLIEKHPIKALTLTLLALAGVFWVDKQIQISDRKYGAIRYICDMPARQFSTHRVVGIERIFYNKDKDGKYNSEYSIIKFHDGCQEKRELPWYVLGRTKEDYEEIFRSSTDVELNTSVEPEVLKGIKQTLTFE